MKTRLGSVLFLILAQTANAAGYPPATLACGKNENGTPVKNYVFEIYENEPLGSGNSDIPAGDVYGRLFSRFDPTYMKEIYSGQMNLFVCNRPKENDKSGLVWFCQDRSRPIRHAQYVKIENADHPKATLYDQYSANPKQILEVDSAPLKLNSEIGACVKVEKK